MFFTKADASNYFATKIWSRLLNIPRLAKINKFLVLTSKVVFSNFPNSF
jgi:hypothetical protein